MEDHTNKRRHGGFTLIEIMVVVVIIGLLVGVVGPNVYKNLFKAQEDIAWNQAKQIDAAVGTYYLHERRIPSMEELLEKGPDGRAHLEGFENEDPWGTPYEIREGESPNTWEVISCGPDKLADTEDDISSKDGKPGKKDE